MARRYGFRGGLVPGATVYGYVTRALLDRFGPRWVDAGAARIRFLAPCYDGDELVVSVSPDGAFVGQVGEKVCVVGSAPIPPPGPGGVEPPAIPAAPIPARDGRPAASEETLAEGRVLGTVTQPVDPDTASEYLTRIGEPSSWYATEGVVHPGLLLEGANRVLMANVVLPAWLHVESDMRHLRRLSVGEEVEVRARVAGQFVRKGHHFVELDVNWIAFGEPVAFGSHTAIWQLAAGGRLEH
ncbi:MAG TPA: hypothetical protein VGL49_04545 [Acidimicrobiales bacterium]